MHLFPFYSSFFFFSILLLTFRREEKRGGAIRVAVLPVCLCASEGTSFIDFRKNPISKLPSNFLFRFWFCFFKSSQVVFFFLLFHHCSNFFVGFSALLSCFFLLPEIGVSFVLFDSLQNPRGRSDQDPSYFRHCLYGSSGCLSCYKKPPLISKVESKRFSKQGVAVKKSDTSDNFWTTSTHDMDNSAVQSQGSISSTSVTNQASDTHGGSGKTSNTTEFVNHGLILWNQTRQQWVGNKKPQIQTQQLREPKLSWNATYESLLGSSKPFAQPIPLPEMVDFLVDIWEQEGLYD